MKRTIFLLLSLALFINSLPAMAGEHEVGQKNKTFTAEQLKVKIGDTVKFTNEDPFYHNIFSLSKVKSFDLGSFKKGKSRTITFSKAGKVDVECAIHPEMHMVIEVSE